MDFFKCISMYYFDIYTENVILRHKWIFFKCISMYYFDIY